MYRATYRKLAISLFVIIFPLILLSCGGDEAANSDVRAKAKMPVPRKTARKKEVKKKASVADAGKAVLRKTLRNPFQSYILPVETGVDKRVRGPLECCEIGLFRLVAVISGIDNPRALIMAPDGKKYITKKGDLIGLKAGKILKIAKSKVIVEERFKDSTGGKVVKELVEIKLPSGRDNIR